ncbi:MAG: hypothetical protein ABJD07_07520 [Gemmatimonadaceae bacterium]
MALVLSSAACASTTSTTSTASSGTVAPAVRVMSPSAPSPDPRVGLGAGWFNAAEAIWNLGIVSKTPPSEKFLNLSTPGDRRLVNSDLAFLGNYVIQGNYSGYQVWDISNVTRPTLRTAFVCPGSQSDVSVYKNLMFVSAEAVSGRVDCGMEGVQDTVSNARARGIRIFDISDIAHPKSVVTVQTCRGSHTNTLVTDPRDDANIYIYVSGSSTVRSPNELAGCSGGTNMSQDPNTALFRLEVIKVPLAHPEQSAIVSSPRVFNDLSAATRHGETAADSAQTAAMIAAATAAGQIPRGPRPGAGLGPTQCHDITAYPAIGLAGGACGGYGILLDIRDPAHPRRISAVADTNFAAWHSVTFNNDGSKILFSDEWGGGSQPRCRATDSMKWGADAIYTLVDGKMTFQSYFKMPAPQTSFENCVAHNGSLIPIPGRDIMVQSWYQGGIDVFEFTDPAHPREIAYFDRGPMDATKFVDAGYWSAYWYNGYIVGSEIARGMDVFELKPSAFLSQNEIDAAKLVHADWMNIQGQPQFVWPASFSVPRAYLDQLVRNNGLARERSTAIARALDGAEQMSGPARGTALTQLAAQLDGDVQTAADGTRVQWMAAAVRKLADAQR